MGIFKFFKKEKLAVKIETIYQDKLSEWLSNKKKQHQEKESEFLVPIKERIDQLISELKTGIEVLEGVDIEAKKVDDRIKFIVKENLKNYIEY
ncbi:MAG: hypothetical protein U9Q99_00875, partial [Nanoarchaeota archaeon]|nr:hypothetical protein [Nanoarchaeota archaeon]